MDWDKLRIFHAVADAGSLTHAGDTLVIVTIGRVPPSARLRRIAEHKSVPSSCAWPDPDRTGRVVV